MGFDYSSSIPAPIWQGACLGEREATAAFEEMRFWLPIMSDHARLIRNGFDLAADDVFRYSDALGVAIDGVLAAVRETTPPFPPGQAECFIAETNRVVVPLRDFKAALTGLIEKCQIRTDRPAGLIEHVRREADLYLGIVNGLVGGQAPTREDLKIPAPNCHKAEPAALAPRSLIPSLGEAGALVLTDETLFFTEINGEHAATLSIYFRPGTQDQLSKDAAATGEAILALRNRMAEAVERGSTICQMKDLLSSARELVVSWAGQLQSLKTVVGTCAVPTGEVNFPFSILDHMLKEAGYTLELLDMACRA
ncbi:MAG: DUF2935 domain-containing protein [Clostridia bacterium]|nr:DUF2935 domain-containing protein [Clostridia bacterium]